MEKIVKIVKDVLKTNKSDDVGVTAKNSIAAVREEFVVFPKEYFTDIENYKSADVVILMRKIQAASLNLFAIKDKDYDGSWQKDGLVSAFLNLKRKFDRLESQFKNGFTGDAENIGDTLIDLQMYSLMNIYFLYEKDDQVKEFIDQFIEDNYSGE